MWYVVQVRTGDELKLAERFRHEIKTEGEDIFVPMYERRKKLIYGNEAAPELIFSREPNELSGIGSGFFVYGFSHVLSSRWERLRIIYC